MRSVNLFCLPHAGGNATVYRERQARLPAWIHVIPLHLPGRGARYKMPLVHQWPTLLDLLCRDMQPYLTQRWAIFGHSLGALVGIELAHVIRTRYGCTPIWLGASGCAAPSRQERELEWLDCPQDELRAKLQAFNGTPQELLDNAEFFEAILPVLRADFHLAGTYPYQAKRPLHCPILVLGGAQDEISEEPLNLSAWSRETSGPCRFHLLEGDHFFINTCRDTVLSLIIDDLARASADAM